MVSKSRKQRQKQKAKKVSGDTEPTAISTTKSIHLKKTRPNMKGKMKIRMGHESADIYEGFEDTKGTVWKCPTCNRVGRVTGFCIECEAAKIAPQQQQKTDKATIAAATAAVVKSASAAVKPKKAAKSAQSAPKKKK